MSEESKSLLIPLTAEYGPSPEGVPCDERSIKIPSYSFNCSNFYQKI